MFNNITLIKKDAGGNEVKRIKVPLAYGSKEKYLARLMEDPENKMPTQLALPRMQFTLTNVNYDQMRKQQTMIKNRSAIAGNANKMNTQFVPVPYDLFFQLQIMTREISDGLQILNMIVPNFTPDYTVNIAYSSTIGAPANKDTPIILNNVEFDDTTEGPAGEIRLIIWSLNFTMKGYVFGPERTQSQIKRVQMDFHLNGLTPTPYIIDGEYLSAETIRGSNTITLSANVANTINTNNIIKIGSDTIKVTGVSGNTLTGNLKFTTTARELTVEKNGLNAISISRYTASISPNTALITDYYVIDDMFEDFT